MPWQQRKKHFNHTVGAVALTTVLNEDQRCSKVKRQLAHGRDPEPEKGLTNVLAQHQAGDQCIRCCHSQYGMWHSVASAPVAWCIFMSKMLRLRVTTHSWYGTAKPLSITQLTEGTSQSIDFLGFTLSTAQLQCHISCFDNYKMIDHAWSSKKCHRQMAVTYNSTTGLIKSLFLNVLRFNYVQ